jgi:lysine 6-dehydrogenase
MNRIIVLGAGMVGSAIAVDLAKRHQVTVADRDIERLNYVRTKSPDIDTIELDFCDDKKLQSYLTKFELVVSAVPGSIGFDTLKNIIQTGKNVVDISFFPENCLDLSNLAKEKNVTAFVDCGVAPGLDNMILGHYDNNLEMDSFECLVGGLPEIRKWPFYYKAPFSPADVLEEYTRPARYVENGKLVTIEPLTDCELVDFQNAGTLESFTTDGLRSIIFTMPHIRNMKEKTLRYPGHAEYIRVLKESGFFSKEEIRIDGKGISPFDITSKVLFKEWKMGRSDKDLTIMRIILRGKNENGNIEKIEYDLFDKYDEVTGTSSMARTTGYTAAAVSEMFLSGLFNNKGVFPPELIGKNETCFNHVIDYLNERDIRFNTSSSVVQSP